MTITQGQSKPRLDYIDGLRALACIAVIFCHTSQGFPWSFDVGGLKISNAAWYLGYLGVNCFLVLSGFCLWSAYGEKPLNLRSFAYKRIRRIVPPYLIGLTLLCIYSYVSHGFTFAYLWRYWLVHAAFLETSLRGYNGRPFGISWSVATEIGCYAMFPAIVLAFRRMSARPVLVALLTLNAVYRLIVVHGGDQDGDFAVANNALGRCSEFALGMFAAQSVKLWHEGRWPLRWYDSPFIAAAGVQVAWSLTHTLHATVYPRLLPFSDAAWGVAFALLILAASRAGTLLHRVLTTSALVWVGSISYSVYLVHVTGLRIVGYALHLKSWPLPEMIAGELLLIVPICVLLGYTFHVPFERPFMNSRRSAVLPKAENIHVQPARSVRAAADVVGEPLAAVEG